MGTARARLARPAWLRLPRRTARLRLTALYGGLVLVSGVALLASTYVLFERATEYRTPALPKIPHAPAIRDLHLPPGKIKPAVQPPKGPQSPTPLSQTLPQLTRIQSQLAQEQHDLSRFGPKFGTGTVGQALSQLAGDQHQLAQGQHQLAHAVNQLAAAVHQVARTKSVAAAQRATDSHQLLVNSGIALAVVAVLAILAGWLIAGRMLRPIRTITRTARRISSTSLHERLALHGPEDELKELGDTLDGLFARLEGAFEAQRHFVANASHELRTPLTAERTLLQVALDDPDTTTGGWRSTANKVLVSNGEHARLIEALLTLASSESGLNGQRPVELSATVAAALVDLQPEIDRLGIHVDEVIRPAPLEGDPLLVARLVANVLTNAVRHNVVGGRVDVLTGVRAERAFVSVTNTGPAIPPADIDRLFQPFQRLDRRRASNRNGHGLGLSIVQAIANAHHAEVNMRARPEGGITIDVSFPPPSGRLGSEVRAAELHMHRGA